MGPRSDYVGGCDELSRRQLLRRGTAVLGGAAGLGLLDAGAVFARRIAAPRPIPGGLDKSFKIVPHGAKFHILSPGIGSEMSTITTRA
jgi:hypothetical protein